MRKAARLLPLLALAASVRVRREIRSLPEAERQAVFAALTVMKTTSQADGEARFGADFVNYDTFVVKHAHCATHPRCDQGHYGPAFTTYHRAINLRAYASLSAARRLSLCGARTCTRRERAARGPSRPQNNTRLPSTAHQSPHTTAPTRRRARRAASRAPPTRRAFARLSARRSDGEVAARGRPVDRGAPVLGLQPRPRAVRRPARLGRVVGRFFRRESGRPRRRLHDPRRPVRGVARARRRARALGRRRQPVQHAARADQPAGRAAAHARELDLRRAHADDLLARQLDDVSERARLVRRLLRLRR